MRTSKSTTCLFILFLYLCCFVQQCHQLMFGMLAQAIGHAVGNALTITTSMGLSIFQSTAQGFLSAFQHGFSTLHTMSMSLISGFILGNMFLAGFVLFLMAIVPSDGYEYDDFGERSLRGPGIFKQMRHRQLHPLIPIPAHFDNSTGLAFVNSTFNSTLLVRNKRSLLPLVNRTNGNATSFNLTLPSSSSLSANGSQFQYNLRFAMDDNGTDPHLLFGNDTRIPRFLTRLVQRDPLNCLPLLLCGLSAARKPSERTETLNDYAYLLKEFMEPDEEKSDEDSSQEDDLKGSNNNRYRQTPMKWLNKLVGGKKKKDEVDEILDEMRKAEDEEVEELALEQMADDPNDIKYALEDMKLRGLKKTVSKLPHSSKKKYISKLMKDESDSGEAEEEMINLDYDPDDIVGLDLVGHPNARNEYPDSYSRERGSYYHDYDKRNLVRGGYPPPPEEPPMPQYGVSSNMLYKKNLKILEDSLQNGPPQRRWIAYGPPPQGPRRSKRDMKWENGPPPPRGYLQKKRGEAAAADNVFDRARVGAEVGAATRNNRQCRALFNECPINSFVRPSVDNSAPFINRAVNNIRRVFTGTTPEGSKQRRVNEIKQVIQELRPPTGNHGGSEVRVVLNIGPSGPPMVDLHRAGGSPPPPYAQQSTNMNPYQNQVAISTNNNGYSHQYTSYKDPSPPPPTTKRPMKVVMTTPQAVSVTTRKTMNYRNPALPSPRPTKDLSHLESILRTTMPSVNSDEEGGTTYMPEEDTTLISFADIDSGEKSEEMEDEPVFPTDFPIPKDKYADNLRETFDIFKRFKEANKRPQGSTLTTVRPRSSTTKKSAVQNSGGKFGTKKVPLPKPEQADAVQHDLDHEEDDVQGILSLIKKFREKYTPILKGIGKKKRKKKKHKKKKKPDSSEESSEEDPANHYIPTLVAVPPPALKRIHWRSGTTLIKDGVYHLLFGGRQVKPLPETPPHPHSGSTVFSESTEDHYSDNKPIRHDVHYDEPPSPPVIHHHPNRLRASASEQDEQVEPTKSPTSSSGSTSKPKNASKSKSKSKSKPKSKLITVRPIKIKLKTPTPLVLPGDEDEEEEEDDFPPPPGPPPPHPPPYHIWYREDSSTYEDDDDYSVGPTRPQLMYTPFTQASSNLRTSSKSRSKRKASKKGATTASPSSGRSLSKRISRVTSSKPNTSLTSKLTTLGRSTTAKPKRKVLKYKNG